MLNVAAMDYLSVSVTSREEGCFVNKLLSGGENPRMMDASIDNVLYVSKYLGLW